MQKKKMKLINLGFLVLAVAIFIPRVVFAHGGDGPDLQAYKTDPEYKKAVSYGEDISKLSSEMHGYTMRMINEVQLMAKTGNVERDFAELLAHQNQSVADLGELALKYGKDPELRQIAARLVEQRKSDIVKIKDWLREHKNLAGK